MSPARALLLAPLLGLGLGLAACATMRGDPGATAEGPLRLQRVVLYQNGVGYFEREGVVEGDQVRLKVRKDQINDLLKSLAVIDRSSGKVLSVSLPLDPRSWHRAALASLSPGHGRLAEVLDQLRGTHVRVDTGRRSVSGRIVMVEARVPSAQEVDEPAYEDHRLSLLDGEQLHVVALSEIQSLSFQEGDLVMQLQRQLDASAGEGMFQQVELSLRLSGEQAHDLSLSYVAPSPQWKPTYRVVLDSEEPGKALLQAWAVVDNVSGENWDGVALSLTAGAPLAFVYDLHTPREVQRPDLSESAAHKRAAVAIGERSFDAAAGAATPAAPPPDREEAAEMADETEAQADGVTRKRMATGRGMRAAAPSPTPAPTLAQMQQSSAAQARAQQISGLTRFDLAQRVTLPDGSATMVGLINQKVRGEQAFLFRPGGSGKGYEHNPYRVVRFHNDTDFALEPGPISIYADGSFVGEGLSEAVGSRESATIPFAVEPSILVRSSVESDRAQPRIVKVVRGVLEVESFERVITHWRVKSKPAREGYRVLIRHPRRGDSYSLVDPPAGTEELADGYFVPLEVKAGAGEAELRLVERTPSRMSLSIWDGRVLPLLDSLLAARDLEPAQRAALQPIVELRRKVGRIDDEIAGLQQQQQTLDQRAGETRESLASLKKDPKAGALRQRLGQRLEQFTAEADALGRRIVELQSQRLEAKIALEDGLEGLEL